MPKRTRGKTPMLISPRLSVRQNPNKIPSLLLSRANLYDVGMAYASGRPLFTRPGATALWEAMHEAGITDLTDHDSASTHAHHMRSKPWMTTPSSVPADGSTLHRWIVLHALHDAGDHPQSEEGKRVLLTVTAWLKRPSEENRQAVEAVVHEALDAPVYYNLLDSGLDEAQARKFQQGLDEAITAAQLVSDVQEGEMDAHAPASTRLYVLKALDRAGILPDR